MGEWVDYWHGGHCDFGEDEPPTWMLYEPDDDQLIKELDNEEVEQENPEEDFWVAEWAREE